MEGLTLVETTVNDEEYSLNLKEYNDKSKSVLSIVDKLLHTNLSVVKYFYGNKWSRIEDGKLAYPTHISEKDGITYHFRDGVLFHIVHKSNSVIDLSNFECTDKLLITAGPYQLNLINHENVKLILHARKACSRLFSNSVVNYSFEKVTLNILDYYDKAIKCRVVDHSRSYFFNMEYAERIEYYDPYSIYDVNKDKVVSMLIYDELPNFDEYKNVESLIIKCGKSVKYETDKHFKKVALVGDRNVEYKLSDLPSADKYFIVEFTGKPFLVDRPLKSLEVRNVESLQNFVFEHFPSERLRVGCFNVKFRKFKAKSARFNSE